MMKLHQPCSRSYRLPFTHVLAIAWLGFPLSMACDTNLEAGSTVHQISPEAYWAQNTNCNTAGEPTWDDPIDGIMQDGCVRCHDYCGSYSTIQSVISNGELESWMQRGHKISGSEQEDVLHWLEIGAPESDCDVAGPECGDNTCEEGETCASCSADCGVCCGDGTCDSAQGEDCGTCVEDCAPANGSVCCDNEIVDGECCLAEDCSTGETCVANTCESSGSDSGSDTGSDSGADTGSDSGSDTGSDSGSSDDSTAISEPSNTQSGATGNDSEGDTGSPSDTVCATGESCDESMMLVGYGCSALQNLATPAAVCLGIMLLARARRRRR